MAYNEPTSAGNIAGTATHIPYFDALTGLMTSDVNFTRDNSTNGLTTITADDTSGKASLIIGSTLTSWELKDDAGTAYSSKINLTPTDATYLYDNISAGTISKITQQNGQMLLDVNDSAGANTFSYTIGLANTGVNSRFFDQASGTISQTQLYINTASTTLDDASGANTFSAINNLTSTGNTYSFTDIVNSRQTGLSIADQVATLGMLAGGNVTAFTIDDSAKLFSAHVGFPSYLKLDRGNNIYKFGDMDVSFDGTYLSIDDAAQTISLAGSYNGPPDSVFIEANFGVSGTVTLGDISGSGTSTTLIVDDPNQRYTLNKLGGFGSGYATVDNSGTLGWGPGVNGLVGLGEVAFGDPTTGLETSDSNFFYNTSSSIFQMTMGSLDYGITFDFSSNLATIASAAGVISIGDSNSGGNGTVLTISDNTSSMFAYYNNVPAIALEFTTPQYTFGDASNPNGTGFIQFTTTETKIGGLGGTIPTKIENLGGGGVGFVKVDNAGTLSMVAQGASGTFLSGDLVPKTITVVNGLITSIV